MRAILRFLSLAAAVVGFSAPAHAQPCDWVRSPEHGIPGVWIADAHAAIEFNDGTGSALYVGGQLRAAGVERCDAIARWDGKAWHSVGTGLGDSWSDTVRELGIYTGRLTAAGHIKSSAGHPLHNLVQWDGREWTDLAGGVNGAIWALHINGDDLYIAGDFTQAGGTPVVNLARWDGNSWHSMGDALDSSPNAITTWRGQLVVGGYLKKCGGIDTNGIALWDGRQWRALGSGLDGYVDSLIEYHGDLIAGGNFKHAGGEPADHIARWDGRAWHPLGSGIPTPSGGIPALRVIKDELFVGGKFNTAGGKAALCVARWNGSEWFDIGFGVWDAVEAITLFGGEPIVVGRFEQVGPDKVGALGAAHWNGAAWEPMNTGLNDDVEAVASYDGKIILGGKFVRAGTLKVQRVVAWDGHAFSSLGSGLDGTPLAFTVHDARLIAGGEFAHAGEVPAQHIAAWDGRQWSSMGDGLAKPARSFAEFNGELFAASGDYVFRWNGSVWQPMGSYQGPVWSITVIDGLLYASYGGDDTQWTDGWGALFAWDGVQWTQVGNDPMDPIYCVASNGGELVVGSAPNVFHIVNGDWQWLGEPTGGYFYAFTNYQGRLIGAANNSMWMWDGAVWHPIGGWQFKSVTIHEDQLVGGGEFEIEGWDKPGAAAYWMLWPCLPCYPDFDESGSLDIDDFITFQTLYAADDQRADCDEDGDLETLDFMCFQKSFAQGCP